MYSRLVLVSSIEAFYLWMAKNHATWLKNFLARSRKHWSLQLQSPQRRVSHWRPGSYLPLHCSLLHALVSLEIFIFRTRILDFRTKIIYDRLFVHSYNLLYLLLYLCSYPRRNLDQCFNQSYLCFSAFNYSACPFRTCIIFLETTDLLLPPVWILF